MTVTDGILPRNSSTAPSAIVESMTSASTLSAYETRRSPRERRTSGRIFDAMRPTFTRAEQLPPDAPIYRPPQPGPDLPTDPPVAPVSDPPVLPPDDPGTPMPVPGPITL